MYRKVLVISLFVLATLNIGSINAASRGRYEGNYGNRRPIYYTGAGGQQYPPQMMMGEELQTAQTPKQYLDQKSGFSTFGIISIMFVIIVFCLAFYYGVMCYPLLCGHEKKYRYMSDISSTITAATSHSIQSIENYQTDQKQQSCI